MPVRRNADPMSVQLVWDSLRYAITHRQQTDMPRLSKYLQRAADLTATHCELYVRQVLTDNMILTVKRTVMKGTKIGQVHESYRVAPIDNSTPIEDGHDWYCIECHLAGDVICCRTCHRVFHAECAHAESQKLKDTRAEVSSSKLDGHNASVDEEICRICHMLRAEKPNFIERNELNYLLNFTLNRIRIWLPSNITDIMAPRVPHPWMTEQEIAWRVRNLIYQTMDIPIMEMKLRTKEYRSLAEFHADVITIQHNVAIFHGLQSQEMQGSELMLTDCRYDLAEILQCVDCYRHSNERRNEMWFCIPCEPPHQLVWAKQKGYPFWPAKVIRTTPDQQYDVRFFGAKHLRALVDKNQIRPIETILKKLQIKRTQGFNKASQELTEYQRLLQNPEEVAQIMLHTPEIKFKSPNTKKQQRKRLKPNETPNIIELDDSLTPEPESEKKKPRNRKKQSDVDKATPKLNLTQRHSSDTLSVESDQVSSSTENVGRPMLCPEATTISVSRSRSGSGTQPLDRAYSDPVETLRRQLELMSDKDEMIRVALETMQQEIDRCQAAHSEHLRSMVDAQHVMISEIKKKQWCYNCEQEAIYHCCWNTAYCSTMCQQQHWQSEHKKVCRRKR